MASSLTLPIGVCSWSIDRNDCVRAIDMAANELDVVVIQLGFFSHEIIKQADVTRIVNTAQSNHIMIPSVFVGFENEDYTSIEAITETGGLLPDALYDQRLSMIQDAARLAAKINANTVAIHVGTVPPDSLCMDYQKLVDRCGDAAAMVADQGLRLLLETGRESIDTLCTFMEAVDRENVAVNFDPGNLMIYGVDDPVPAVSKLKGRIEMVHLKDVLKSDNPGVDYGHATAMGTGDVQIPRVISKLRAIGYTGPLLIENNIPSAGLQPIKDGIKYIRSMLE